MTVRDSSMGIRRAMIGLATVALFAFFATALPMHSQNGFGPDIVHAIVAVGMMPLMLSAMIYFTPVLTHSRAPGWPILPAPMIVLIAGSLAAGSLAWRRDLIPIAASVAILAVATVFGWMWRRAHTMLGSPHPGLYWYLLALIHLLFGLTAILLAILWPEHWAALRRFHLHVNLLGFAGMTAIGTLRVLVPTVAGYADPDARPQLHRGLYFAASGTLLIASGAGWWNWLAWPGLALWSIPLLEFALPLVGRWRKFVWGWHRASAALGISIFGYLLVLAAGALHAGGSPPSATVPLFFFAFLFPLVTGAVSYLLPVWIWPARNTPAYELVARELAHGSAARGLLFLTAGVLTFAGVVGAAWLAVATLAAYWLQAAWVFSRVFTRFRSSA